MTNPLIVMADITQAEFNPHPLFKSAHLQTILPSLTRLKNAPDYRRQRLELPDDDYLDLDWFQQNPQSIELVVLIHGLGGSSGSKYIARTGNALVKAGFSVVAYNLRGAAGPNRLPRSYHSGETTDLQYVLDYLSGLNASQRIYAVGFSLGANMLLKWLGENGDQGLVRKAVAVSVPFELSAVSHRLNKGASKIYRATLLKNLKKLLSQKESLVKDLIDLSAGYNAKTFHQYDDAVTAPLNGFRDVDDYYTRSSSRQYLPAIDTPTLILHARDDPFTTPEIIPQEVELGPGVVLELSDHGGHVGFVEKGRGLGVKYWLPARITKYLLETTGS